MRISSVDALPAIAAHFQRDVRTVRRWEAFEGLPVHRHQHQQRGTVYAFVRELDEWWHHRLQSPARPPAAVPRRLAAWLWPSIAAVVLAAGGLYHVYEPAGAPATSGPPGRLADDPRRPASIDPESYRLYLSGRYHLTHSTGQMERARQDLESAASRAPAFAPVYASLADVYSRIARSRPDATDAWARADASAQRALGLDATLPLAHVGAGTIWLFRDQDWARSKAAFLRAVALASHDPDACNDYAVWLRAAGDIHGAILQRQRALEADPVNVTLMSRLAEDYVYARRYEDAIREYQKALELERDYRPALDGLADAFARRGLTEQAGTYKVRVLMLRGARGVADEFERRVRLEGYAAADRWLDRRNLEGYLQHPSANAWNLAFTYARLGEKEPAFRWLEEAMARRDSGLLQLRVDPDVDSLRGDPRFGVLLRRLGPASSAPPKPASALAQKYSFTAS